MRSPSNNEGHEIEKFLKKCFDINKKYIHLWTVVPKDCPPSTIQTNIGFKKLINDSTLEVLYRKCQLISPPSLNQIER